MDETLKDNADGRTKKMDQSYRRGKIDVAFREKRNVFSLYSALEWSRLKGRGHILHFLFHIRPHQSSLDKKDEKMSAQLWRKLTFGWAGQIDKEGNQGPGTALRTSGIFSPVTWTEVNRWAKISGRFSCGCHTDVPLAAPRLAFRTSFLHPGYDPSVASAEQSCDTNGAAIEGCGLPFVAGTKGCRPLPQWIISALWQRFRTGTVNLGVKQAAEGEIFRHMGTSVKPQ